MVARLPRHRFPRAMARQDTGATKGLNRKRESTKRNPRPTLKERGWGTRDGVRRAKGYLGASSLGGHFAIRVAGVQGEEGASRESVFEEEHTEAD